MCSSNRIRVISPSPGNQSCDENEQKRLFLITLSQHSHELLSLPITQLIHPHSSNLQVSLSNTYNLHRLLFLSAILSPEILQLKIHHGFNI